MASQIALHRPTTQSRGKKWFSINARAISRAVAHTVSASLVFNQVIFANMAAADTTAPVWIRLNPHLTVAAPIEPETIADAAQPGDVDALTSMLASYAETLPSLDQLANRFGNDPEAAFLYVRDTIRTEPYAGTLRNPTSVIAASGGNLQDKSELLLTLLRKMGMDARIATAPMTDEISNHLRARVCGIALMSDVNISELLNLGQDDTRNAISRAQRDYGLLLDAASNTIDAVGSIATTFGPTHFWVQYRHPEGWRDLDPSVVTMAPGDAFAQPTSLSEGGADPHMVTLSVVVETLSKGRLREKTVLTHKISARDAYDMPIQIGFVPAGAGLGGVLADALGDAIDLAPQIKPVVIQNWEMVVGSAFAQPGPAVADGLGDAQDPVTAVWLDYSASAPQGETRSARRAVIDLLTFPSRQAAEITPDMVVMPAKGLRYAEELEGMRQIIVSNGGLDPSQDADRLSFIMERAGEIYDSIEDGTIQPDSLIWLMWAQTHAIAAGAERATRDLRSADGSICGFSGRANVMTAGFTPKGTDDFLITMDWTLDGIDIASSIDAPDPNEAAAMRVWYGTVRSAIETFALNPGSETVVSASALLPGPLARLSPDAVLALGVRSAQEDLENGYLIYGLTQPQSQTPAWWRVDPTSGAADARLADLGNFGVDFGGGNYVNGGGYGRPHRVLPDLGRPRPPHPSFPKKAKGNTEYTVILIVFAIPTAIVAGYMVNSIIERRLRRAAFAVEMLEIQKRMEANK